MVVVDTTRAALDRLAGDSALLSHARLIPRTGNGQPDGLTLYNIAPGSLFAVLGMRGGDTLLSINNRSVISPTSALLHMPDASDFLDISLERHGVPMRIVVLIHG